MIEIQNKVVTGICSISMIKLQRMTAGTVRCVLCECQRPNSAKFDKKSLYSQRGQMSGIHAKANHCWHLEGCVLSECQIPNGAKIKIITYKAGTQICNLLGPSHHAGGGKP